MAVFHYTGVKSDSTVVRGTVSADTPRQARDQLRGEGIRVKKIGEANTTSTTKKASLSLPLRSFRVQWATAIHEMAMMLHAGIPILDALDTVADQNRGPFRVAMLKVRDRVASGSSLAGALAEQPKLFDPASIHMVEVGENSGTLDAVLQQLAQFKRKQLTLRNSVTTALVYPLFLTCFGTAAAIFLMTSVLPPLLENLEETMEVLPWPTQIAKYLSNLLLDYGWLLAVLVIGILFSLISILRTDWGQRYWHQKLLKLPILGPMTVKQGVSRIAMIIATLSRSGIELTKAVELAERSTSNRVFKSALKRFGERIAAGEDVSDALAKDGAFPPLAVRVFSVGQESGKLDEMLFQLADDYDEQVATASARLTALLEPALILILAAAVGFLLLATILPILEAGNVM
ncbi:MAG: type II secretion system F family protein [Planctomycetaceae bacterium]|nr:type II secretion system F family protein [Planctomycetaceae bacterium]